MNSATVKKLRRLVQRCQQIQNSLADPKIISDPNKFRDLSIELAEIEPVVNAYCKWQGLQAQVEETQLMLTDGDAAIRQLAKDELPILEEKLKNHYAQLQTLLLPQDRRDKRNVFLEIRAGTGGDEAALFAGDLFKMYFQYAERCKWQVEVISSSDGEHGGYKEIISLIKGKSVYGKLKFESGAHRVQRVPETESQGRIHTSTCTVAVLAEPEKSDEIEINQNDIRVDTFRASGAGGQHVNKTDSAIRITHIASGLVVECQDQRSQHKNRARAMAILKARLADAKTQAQQQKTASERKILVGSGERSERIRTYNFPQGRITDHRINLTLYKLEGILGGDLEPVITSLAAAHRADLLSSGE